MRLKDLKKRLFRFKKIKLFKSDKQEIRFHTIIIFICLTIYIVLSTLRQLQ